jgi:hypothetical protein
MKLPRFTLRALWIIGIFALWAVFLVVGWRVGAMNDAINYVRANMLP